MLSSVVHPQTDLLLSREFTGLQSWTDYYVTVTALAPPDVSSDPSAIAGPFRTMASPDVPPMSLLVSATSSSLLVSFQISASSMVPAAGYQMCLATDAAMTQNVQFHSDQSVANEQR